MIRLLKIALVGLCLAAGLWFGVHAYAEYRVRSAFAAAGMSDGAARCMGRRLVERLSLVQLRKLGALQQEKHTVDAMVEAVRGMDDPRIVKVTARSALLCSTGLDR